MSDNWIKKVPGPGTYSALDITSKEKTPVSKYLSPASSRFGQVKRLSEAEMKNSKTPGPGNCIIYYLS